MRINFAQELRDLKGNVLQINDVKDDNPIMRGMRLSDICVMALIAQEDTKLTREQAFRRGLLAERIIDKGEVDITLDEAVLMQNLIEQQKFGVIVMMRAITALENVNKEEQR